MRLKVNLEGIEIEIGVRNILFEAIEQYGIEKTAKAIAKHIPPDKRDAFLNAIDYI